MPLNSLTTPQRLPHCQTRSPLFAQKWGEELPCERDLWDLWTCGTCGTVELWTFGTVGASPARELPAQTIRWH